MAKLLAATLLVWLTCAACSGTLGAPAGSAKACSVDQAAENPLHDRANIADMQVITKPGRRGNPLAATKQAIAIVLRPERGLTLEWLAHVLECDVGQQHGVDSACPLALPTARVRVDSVEGRLVVYVSYSDPASLARARELASQFRADQARGTVDGQAGRGAAADNFAN